MYDSTHGRRHGRRRGDDGEESIFDNPLMTPPTTDAPTGNWDDDGPLRGWRVQFRAPTLRERDYIIEDRGEAYGRQYFLLRVTEYVPLEHYTPGDTDYGESETWYEGHVYAPDVDSFPKGYGSVTIADCYPDDHWFKWSESNFWNGRAYGETMQEAAIRKTKTLARGLSTWPDDTEDGTVDGTEGGASA